MGPVGYWRQSDRAHHLNPTSTTKARAMQIEWGKLLVLLFAIAGAVVLRVVDGIAAEAATGIIMGALGYAFGNGRLAATGKEPQPLIKRRDPGA